MNQQLQMAWNVYAVVMNIMLPSEPKYAPCAPHDANAKIMARTEGIRKNGNVIRRCSREPLHAASFALFIGLW